MNDDDNGIWPTIIYVLTIILTIAAFFYMLTGCTAGRDACYICLSPSLEINRAKPKPEAGAPDGSGGAQPGHREESGDTGQGGAGVQPR